MILRRLTNAFRKQDWFTVAVETLIVVFGVFIGLQVSNWNEARSDQVSSRVVLERLEQDFEQILERADISLATHDSHLKAAGRLILGIRNQEFEEETLLDDIGAASSFSTLPGASSTFTQLVSSGRLELIQSQDLRRALTEYHAYLNFAQSQFGVTFATPLIEARETLLKATVIKVTNVPSTDFSQYDLPEVVDRNMLLTDPEMMTTLQVCYDVQDNIYLINYRTRGQVLAILEQIRAEQERAR
jgi:hypothetical protein